MTPKYKEAARAGMMPSIKLKCIKLKYKIKDDAQSIRRLQEERWCQAAGAGFGSRSSMKLHSTADADAAEVQKL